ncbi:MAG: excinuclease ABC subunit A [Cycloclasticus sp. symbiont of Poecilosclerida sp. M]|nr:MAG: excinuclease ABC subunit A [Cycloclasticus sp. symbiont of Poecilosclerida sp. M]
MDTIQIRGARTHNLKNIDLDLPREKLIVITGLSGSGKSSLAFDTIYAEGQRRYVESLSAYARQFLSVMEKPDVDHIEGLSPAISIEQKSTSHNPRSTVGTITEIYDYLRLLFARTGTPQCPEHGTSLEAQTITQMVNSVLSLDKSKRWMLLAPVIQERKGEHFNVISDLRNQGFIRARIDGEVVELEDAPTLELKKKHTIEVVVDRFKINDELSVRLAESFETALKLTDGIAVIADIDGGEELLFSTRFACPTCGYSIAELEPRSFSFNSPKGACTSCDGLGIKQYINADRVLHSPEISLAGGAIRGWDKRNMYYYQLILSLATHYKFDPEQPFNSLPLATQQAVLFGSGDEEITFKTLTSQGKTKNTAHSFEGIIHSMERRYHETDSSMVRDELAKYLSKKPCPDCKGQRLNIAARNVFINEHTLSQITGLSILKASELFATLALTGQRGEIAKKIIKEIKARLDFLINVGLDYLSLDRSADTLSGGEAQRIRLASQIGAGLVGVLYVLDEPSIGLHQRDNQRLIDTLIHLRDIGNTVIVVEHDEEAILSADHVVDIGPNAGVHGGIIIAEGSPQDILDSAESLTGQYLSGRKFIPVPAKRHQAKSDQALRIINARANNLKNITISLPIGLLTCVTGVSGSGKSTLINETLYPAVARELNKSSLPIAACDAVGGIDLLDKVVDIDQSPIGRTPRSNPATYTGLFTPIRELFAATPESRSRGYTPSRFSFNVKGGRCEACKGDGVIKVEMHFLADVYVNCDSCKGQRFNRESLEIRYKGKTIHDVLSMTVEDAFEFFSPIPVVHRKLHTLMEVGLGYITLGQNATTLSGGEAQRVKLSRELSKRDTGKTLYILDEPTTGLHFHDIQQLLTVLHTLRDHGNTVIVIEHNLDVVKTADWVIDLGPEGGDGGGTILAEGSPELVADISKSHTGLYLKPLLYKTKHSKPA